MVILQVLNKVIATKNIGLLLNNDLDQKHFKGYEEEYNFVINHFRKFNTVPDYPTVLEKFKDFEVLEVTEPDSYLVEKIKEGVTFVQGVTFLEKAAQILEADANEFVEFVKAEIVNFSSVNKVTHSNIIANAQERYNEHINRAENDSWLISTGLQELDLLIDGWVKGEELAVVVARTGIGKSWLLVKTLQAAWQQKQRVGYISPEMSATKLGYRFDTIFKNFSNKDLFRGNLIPSYKEYIEDLQKSEVPFFVSTPKDFDKKITVSKLKNYILANNLDILGIDGITYLTDERYQKGQNKTTTLTNISEDLSAMSLELGVPIIIVVQANRGGVKTEDTDDSTPDLENIRDSDGIAQNATKVLALGQLHDCLQIVVKKNRDGVTGKKVTYQWDIDTGVFNYVPVHSDSVPTKVTNNKINELKENYNDSKEDIF